MPLIKGPVVTTPYFVWLMHSRLGESEARVDLPGLDGILGDDSGGLTAAVSQDRVTLLLWHFDLLRPEPRRWTIQLDHLPPALEKAQQLRLTEYLIDGDHNNPYTEYVVRGADDREGAYNLETATLVPSRSDSLRVVDQQASVEVVLPNQSVMLLEIEAAR